MLFLASSSGGFPVELAGAASEARVEPFRTELLGAKLNERNQLHNNLATIFVPAQGFGVSVFAGGYNALFETMCYG